MNAQLLNIIQKEINERGKISFARYMELALYTPGLGYYASDLKKFGKEGDFVTAPEISSLFSQCLAKQIQQILLTIKKGDILEFGAGSGKMALDLLLELEKLECLPKHYFILELSANLQERQQAFLSEKIPHLFDRIHWLENLPDTGFKGVVIANEVVDAMPVHKCKLRQSKNSDFDIFNELYVSYQNDEFCWQEDTPSSIELTDAIQSIADTLMLYQEKAYILPQEYESEINLNLPTWLNALSEKLDQGIVLLIDYGYPRHEYYHPERAMGTVSCHYQHQLHSDPLLFTGMQDITAQVDFTAVASAALDAGFTIAGYIDQAHFLFNCGLIDLISREKKSPTETFALNQQVKLLTLPNEMGELVKVIALSKNMHLTPLGFQQQDKSARLFKKEMC